ASKRTAKAEPVIVRCCLKYLYDDTKPDKLAENPKLYKTPVVRNGRQATVGYCPDIWKEWE
ncbi:MAG: arsenate reductase family protein, partial [Oscillospiraceae bacterium]